MHILILGSGIIGATTAYYLARQGHQVTVLDRQSNAAMETSFANAGQISPGYSAPWAAPGIPMKAIKWMMSEHAPLVINPKPEWAKIKFIANMLGNCSVSAYQLNKGRMLRLAEYSRQSLQQLQADTGIAYDERSLGTLQVFRSEKQLKAARQDMALLEQYEIPHQLLDREGCLEVEPGLHKAADKILGGLRLPLDQTGDCHLFSNRLVDKCRELGVEFAFDTSIERIVRNGKEVTEVVTDKGVYHADAYVMALGSYSTALLKQLGIASPVYPVKGYSITLPIVDEATAPTSTIMDETYKVALTRLGQRIRVAGTAELNGFNLGLDEKRRATVRHVVNDLFPGGGDMSEDQFWTGLRPMTPDGTPIVGRSALGNLFLNTGHGTLGWTMSFGSARLLADIVSERTPEIEHRDLDLSRYTGSAKKRGFSTSPATAG